MNAFSVGKGVVATCAARLAGPLGADVHIGLPAAEHARVATFAWPDLPPGLGSGPPMRHNAYFNPADLSGHGVVNSPRWRSAEIPSANVHATARGVARVYAALAAGGRQGGTTIVDAGALPKPARAAPWASATPTRASRSAT